MDKQKFVKSVYKVTSVKWALSYWLIYILVAMFIWNNLRTNTWTVLYTTLLISVLLSLNSYRGLSKEALRNLQNYNEKNGENYITCNLKQSIGPVLGAVTVGESIKFNAHRDNSQYKNFEINLSDNPNMKIEIRKSKLALIEKLFSKDLTKIIIIKNENKKIKLQAKDPEALYSKINLGQK